MENDFFSTKRIVAIISVMILLIAAMFFNPIAHNDSTNRQVIQTITGEMDVRFKPGIYWKGFGSKHYTWPNNFTIQISQEKNHSEDADYWIPSNEKDGVFSEGDNATLEHTVKSFRNIPLFQYNDFDDFL